MLIIVEGPDGAGKSTLIQRLVNELGDTNPRDKVEVLKKGPPHPTQHPLDEYVTPLLSYRPGLGHHIICDRWHVGEWIYPEVLGRTTQADRAVWYYTEMFLASRGALVFYPRTPVDVIKERVTRRGDDLVAVHQLAKVFAGYDYMRDQHLLPYRHWTVDTTHAVQTVLVHGRHRENMAKRLNTLTTYVGPPAPEWLLVGDIRIGTYDGDLRPAFMPYRSTSGHYLFSALRRHQFTSLGVINANDVDDAVWAQYDIFHDVDTVTLGNHARGKMNGAGRDHPGVPHPQYVRRFHNKQGDAYAEAIEQARVGKDMITWRPSTSG